MFFYSKSYFILFSILFIELFGSNVECSQNGEYSSIKEAPYYASFVNSEGDSNCGAAILSEYWLVSAGHCAVPYKKYMIRTGASSSFSNGNIYDIDHVIIPDNYSLYTSEFRDTYVHINDIGLIKLVNPIAFNKYQQPIKIRSTPPKENDTVTVVGLGFERIRSDPPSLKKSVQSVAASAPPFGHNPPGVFHLKNSTTHYCPGDSGSPGVIDNELAGVASFVDELCKNWSVSHQVKYPGAFTRIDVFYNWILNHTGIVY